MSNKYYIQLHYKHIVLISKGNPRKKGHTMEAKMNAFLSDLVVEYHKLQSLHWYVRGPQFFQAHAQLEVYYDEVRDMVDDVAEAMLMEGLHPVSRMGQFLELSGIEEAPGDFVDVPAAVELVLADFSRLLASAKELKRAAEEAGSDLVAAKADGYIEGLAKAVWMLGQSR